MGKLADDAIMRKKKNSRSMGIKAGNNGINAGINGSKTDITEDLDALRLGEKPVCFNKHIKKKKEGFHIFNKYEEWDERVCEHYEIDKRGRKKVVRTREKFE